MCSTRSLLSIVDHLRNTSFPAGDRYPIAVLDAVELAGSDARVTVMRNEQFGFARLTVERPMRRT